MNRVSRFDTTRWSVVLLARARGEPGSEESLARLCETYWYPLYAFVRRQGHGPEDALDFTQGYFLRLMERDWLKNVRPEAGKFRSFLLVSMKHFLAHERRRAKAKMRGGEMQWIPLDAAGAEGRYRLEPRDPRTPEQAYERSWAQAVLDRARRLLEQEMEKRGGLEQYRLLEPHLSREDVQETYRDLARRLGTTEAAVKMSLMRLRRRLGRILRDEVATTVGGAGDVDGELRYLLGILREG